VTREQNIQEIADMLCDLDDRHVAEIAELVSDAVAMRIARREFNRDKGLRTNQLNRKGGE
jgi:hypothetical protein